MPKVDWRGFSVMATGGSRGGSIEQSKVKWWHICINASSSDIRELWNEMVPQSSPTAPSEGNTLDQGSFLSTPREPQAVSSQLLAPWQPGRDLDSALLWLEYGLFFCKPMLKMNLHDEILRSETFKR
jgi:hypothetical protein